VAPFWLFSIGFPLFSVSGNVSIFKLNPVFIEKKGNRIFVFVWVLIFYVYFSTLLKFLHFLIDSFCYIFCFRRCADITVKTSILSKWLIKPQSIFLFCWILNVSVFILLIATHHLQYRIGKGFFSLASTWSSHCVLLFWVWVLCGWFYCCFLAAECALLIMMQENNYLRQEKVDSSQSFFFLLKIPRYIPFLQPVLWSEMFSCVWELDWDLSLHSCVPTHDQSNRFAICYRHFIYGAMWNIKQISFVFS